MAKFVPQGVSLPFEYTSYDGQSGKFIGMTVFDTTSGTPVQVNLTPIAMAHMFQGTYVGYFTPDPNKNYIVHKMVYTDITYTVLNTNYSPGSESFSTQFSSLAEFIWNFDISAIVGAAKAGFVLYTIPVASVIADAVWNALRATHTLVGSFGEALQGIITPTRAANLDNLDMPISSISTGGLSAAESVVGLVEDNEEIIGIVEDV